MCEYGDVLFTLPNIISHSSGLNRNRVCVCIFGLCCICPDLNMRLPILPFMRMTEQYT